MKTYQISSSHKLANVIRQLRGEGCRAWAETENGALVLCTDARASLIAICSGDGLWAQVGHDGLAY